ncbi:hypothetical protein HGA88_04245 [Candidatus Roizmanbacteria bacterium]|nr:hypothetical protein [Candidatus Roizmanbacteria bacterium]
MRNYYIFIVALTLSVVSIVGYAFFSIGSPISRQEIAYDAKRLQDFKDIKLAIANYAKANRKLPTSFLELKPQNEQEVNFTDPQTKKEYEYNVQTSTSYEFCAQFSTDYNTKDNPTTDFVYKKGRSCQTVDLDSYITNAWPPEKTSELTQAILTPYLPYVSKNTFEAYINLKTALPGWKTDYVLTSLDDSLGYYSADELKDHDSIIKVGAEIRVHKREEYRAPENNRPQWNMLLDRKKVPAEGTTEPATVSRHWIDINGTQAIQDLACGAMICNSDIYLLKGDTAFQISFISPGSSIEDIKANPHYHEYLEFVKAIHEPK